MRAWHRPTAYRAPSRSTPGGLGQVPRFRSRDGSFSRSPKGRVKADRARSEDPENGSRKVCTQVLEANMTVTNVIEVVVVLAILYAAYRFFQKRA